MFHVEGNQSSNSDVTMDDKTIAVKAFDEVIEALSKMRDYIARSEHFPITIGSTTTMMGITTQEELPIAYAITTIINRFQQSFYPLTYKLINPPLATHTNVNKFCGAIWPNQKTTFSNSCAITEHMDKDSTQGNEPNTKCSCGSAVIPSGVSD